MKSLLIKLGSAALALGTVVACAAPSFAQGCEGGWGYGNGGYPAFSGRAQVMNRDYYLNNQISNDYGYLRGNYGRLRGEDASIRRQAQWDAYRNGGYLTYGQMRHLNHEENRLQRQINYDHRWL